MADQISGLSRKRWNILATISFVLVIEMAVAARLVLRQITGENWVISSVAFAFVLVFFLHQPLGRWIWGVRDQSPVDPPE
jgi:hypothetical protein